MTMSNPTELSEADSEILDQLLADLRERSEFADEGDGWAITDLGRQQRELATQRFGALSAAMAIVSTATAAVALAEAQTTAVRNLKGEAVGLGNEIATLNGRLMAQKHGA